MKQSIIFTAMAALLLSCASTQQKQSGMQLIALDPGHFHASLVQQQMYPGIDSVIRVFAPEGPEVQQYVKNIAAFNQKANPPLHWAPEVYTGPDYLSKMLECPPGNIVVIAGNNRLKSTYIRRSIHAGMHVLADKPMAIDEAGFDSLQAAFAEAAEKKVQLYDIMTERYQIHNMLQRALSQLPEVFGTLEKGSASEPAVVKKSVHHFKKKVAGRTLVRPAWYMDVQQQGEGIVDVTTHLVDLVQWTCFPEQALDYRKDIHIDSARRWPTAMTLQQYGEITGQTAFPSYLQKDIDKDSLLQVYANGTFTYRLRDVYAQISVEWGYEEPPGTGDTHYSLLKGSKASLVIRQGAEQGYKPVLYIVPVNNSDAYAGTLKAQVKQLAQTYPGLDVKPAGSEWEVVVPQALQQNHEMLFAKVMQRFLEYIRQQQMPAWEVPNTLAKYYTTTQALALARQAVATR